MLRWLCKSRDSRSPCKNATIAETTIRCSARCFTCTHCLGYCQCLQRVALLNLTVTEANLVCQSRQKASGRLVMQEATLDPYEARKAVDMATGSSPMGDAAQALAAVANAAALAGPVQHFCDLCQVCMPTESDKRTMTRCVWCRRATIKCLPLEISSCQLIPTSLHANSLYL